MRKVISRRVVRTVSSKRMIEIRDLVLWGWWTLLFCIIGIVVVWGIYNWGQLADIISKIHIQEMTVWEIFFSVFGLMYAIMVGLLIVEAHRRWRQLSSAIQGELNVIGDIDDCLGYFSESKQNRDAKEEINKLLLNYVKGMDRFWESMKKAEDEHDKEPEDKGFVDSVKDLRTKTRAKYDYKIARFKDTEVRDIIKEVGKLRPNANSGPHALGAIIDKICDLTTYRTDRQASAEHSLPKSYYVFILIMSVIIVGGILLLNVDNVLVHGLIVFGATGAVTSLFLLLLDVDRPFTGFWRIWKEPLIDLCKKLLPENLSSLASHYRRNLSSEMKEALVNKMVALANKESVHLVSFLSVQLDKCETKDQEDDLHELIELVRKTLQKATNNKSRQSAG